MSRWLVFNADDLGVSRSATLGVIKAHREGVVTSASLAVTTPCYADAVTTCVRTCPDLGIGLHFTLTSGKPVSEANRASLLTDTRGFLRWRFPSLFVATALQRRADLLAQVGHELDAQLDKLHADGIRPDHIDSERHVHLIPGIFELVVAAAKRRGIPFVRAGADVGAGYFPLSRMPGLALRGGFAKSLLLSNLARRAQQHLDGIRTAEQVASFFGSGQMHLAKHSAVNAPVATGGLEVMVHPGVPNASEEVDLGNRELQRYLHSDDRRRELDFCIEARGWVDRPRITNFTRLAAESRAP
jgi:predicted glycoside hydrolase/deacetylase ChbG (UPF0249 family)